MLFQLKSGEQVEGDVEQLVATEPEFRAKSIQGFLDKNNQLRKNESRRRYEVYTDGVRTWVERFLRKETKGDTVLQMMSRATNYNFTKKIIGKLARVYKAAVTRKVVVDPEEVKQTRVQVITNRIKSLVKLGAQAMGMKPPADDPAAAQAQAGDGKAKKDDAQKKTNQVEQLAKVMNTNRVMKKVEKFFHLFRNVAIYIRPKDNDLEPGKYTLRLDVMNPAQFDIIPDEDDPTEAAAVILSLGFDMNPLLVTDPSVFAGARVSNSSAFNGVREDSNHPGEAASQQIAAAAEGKPLDFTEDQLKQMRFVWWTKDSHFVTDGQGTIVDVDPDNTAGKNPIGELPFVFLSGEQDQNFWSLGGQDLIDSTILLNVLLTDLNYILLLHGCGIFYASGDGIPDKIRVGAGSALVFKPKDGSTIKPEVGFATPDAPVEGHLKNIEQQTAILLSTNNLEPSGVATRMNADTAASGIHELIKKADVSEAIEESQDLFRAPEQALHRKGVLWMNKLIDDSQADSKLSGIGSMDPNIEIAVEYTPPQILVSETEKLDVIQKRLSIPLDTAIDAVKRDNPELTDDEAQARVIELETDYKRRMAIKSVATPGPGQGKPGDTATQPNPEEKKAQAQAAGAAAGTDEP